MLRHESETIRERFHEGTCLRFAQAQPFSQLCLRADPNERGLKNESQRDSSMINAAALKLAVVNEPADNLAESFRNLVHRVAIGRVGLGFHRVVVKRDERMPFATDM